jgi:hypothetical protein
MMTLDKYLSLAWERYVRLCPDADRIHSLLEARGERIVNDHLAFRTFDLPGITRHDVGRVFEAWGYRRVDDELDFPEKKLTANYWLPPSPEYPRVFVSELVLSKVSAELASWIRGFATCGPIRAEQLLEPTWAPVRHADYQRFYPESEYAAWTAAFGIQLNHFTVSINALRTFPGGIAELNDYLRASGLVLNEAGGAIKGRPEELLEQSSTQARAVPCLFDGGVRAEIPGCYYEFARRYPLPEGRGLFEGFIPKSADKIFESTRTRP